MIRTSAALLGLILLAYGSHSSQVYVRKDQADMTDEEVKRFVAAVNTLKEQGIYDQFVRIHTLAYPSTRLGSFKYLLNCVLKPSQDEDTDCFNWAHNSPVFLPWHRQYLLSFEKALQRVDPTVTIPYWNWAKDNSFSSAGFRHIWTDQFMGGNGDPSNHSAVWRGPFAYWPLTYFDLAPVLQRNFSTNPMMPLPNEQEVEDLVLAFNEFDEAPYVITGGDIQNLKPSFRKTLEGGPGLPEWNATANGYLHSAVHVWVGGSMGHAQVDRLWELWHEAHPEVFMYEPQRGGPNGTNIDDLMSPWNNFYDTDAYELYYQFSDAVPSGETVHVKDMCKATRELGYIYG